MKDYYSLLGISESADKKEIKKAYHRLAIKFHPDKNQKDQLSETRFKEIQEAYEILSSPQKKHQYDAAYQQFEFGQIISNDSYEFLKNTNQDLVFKNFEKWFVKLVPFLRPQFVYPGIGLAIIFLFVKFSFENRRAPDIINPTTAEKINENFDTTLASGLNTAKERSVNNFSRYADSSRENEIAENKKYIDYMKVVFGKDLNQSTGESSLILSNKNDTESNGAFLFWPIALNVLPTGVTILVTNSVFGEDRFASHATPGYISVYFLKKEKHNWEVISKIQNFMAIGSFGNVGKLSWIKPGINKSGFAISSEWMGQGYHNEWVYLYGITDDKIFSLGSILVESDNDGMGESESSGSWNVKGDWHFVHSKESDFDDIEIDFNGKKDSIFKVDPNDSLRDGNRILKNVKGYARYSFKDGEYKLVAGENIVPEI